MQSHILYNVLSTIHTHEWERVSYNEGSEQALLSCKPVCPCYSLHYFISMRSWYPCLTKDLLPLSLVVIVFSVCEYAVKVKWKYNLFLCTIKKPFMQHNSFLHLTLCTTAQMTGFYWLREHLLQWKVCKGLYFWETGVHLCACIYDKFSWIGVWVLTIWIMHDDITI